MNKQIKLINIAVSKYKFCNVKVKLLGKNVYHNLALTYKNLLCLTWIGFRVFGYQNGKMANFCQQVLKIQSSYSRVFAEVAVGRNVPASRKTMNSYSGLDSASLFVLVVYQPLKAFRPKRGMRKMNIISEFPQTKGNYWFN